MTTYRCSRCGHTGHNRQSCGKTTSLPYRPPTRALPPQTLRKRREESPTRRAPADNIQGLPAEENQLENTGPTHAPSEDDLNTWWNLLAYGKNGKAPNATLYTAEYQIWTRQDTENLTEVLIAAVENDTSPQVLKNFLRQFSVRAQIFLARHERTPPAVTVILARHESYAVRDALTRRTRLDTATVLVLTRDARRETVEKTFDNPFLAPEALTRVWDRDKNFYGKDTGDTTLRGRRAESAKQILFKGLLSHPNCPQNVLDEAERIASAGRPGG